MDALAEYKPTCNDKWRQWIGLRFGSTRRSTPCECAGGWAFLIHSNSGLGYTSLPAIFRSCRGSHGSSGPHTARPSIHPRNRSKRFLPSSCRNTSWQLVFGQKNKSSWLFIFTAAFPYGRIHGRNPEIMALAKVIGRTADAVAMKMLNLASIDPAVVSSGRAGLGNASSLNVQFGTNSIRTGNDWRWNARCCASNWTRTPSRLGARRRR